MSDCTFIASNQPLVTFAPSKEYPLEINIDTGSVYDGGADDNFFLHIFKDVDVYTDKKYGVFLEWDYTDGRAKNILNYIKDALENTNDIELWHVWLMDYYEYEERPIIHKYVTSINDFTIQDIKEIDDSKIWDKEDKMYPDRSSFYCMTITK